MESRAIFERNLAAIRRRSPILARTLEDATTDGVEEVAGPRGDRVLRERGVFLGSAYDPAREAEQMAAKMAEEPADLMVAIGFGLGEQLERYCEGHAITVIVYEPSAARLKAALHRVSIVNLLATQKDLHFATNLEQLSQLVEARYLSGLRTRVFPHPAVLRLDPDSVQAAVERISRVKSATDTRVTTSIESMMPWAWVTALNGRRIAESACFGSLHEAFAEKPAVVVAAGPSLDKQLPLLREMCDRVLVIAIGQTVKALRKAGIEPDLVHVLESRNVSHQLLDAGDPADLNLVLTPDCHSDVFDIPSRATFVSTPSLSPMGGWIAKSRGETHFTMGGGTVALGAVGLALAVGANPIFLIGQDLAFTEGRAYASGSAYEFVGVEVSEEGRCTFTNGRRKVGLLGDKDLETARDRRDVGEVVWVEGWHEGERVPTWSAYATFIEQYRELARALPELGYRLVNCTEGGARLPGLEHIPFAEALDSVAPEPVHASRRIAEIHAAAPVHSIDDFRRPLETARGVLEQVEREVARAEKIGKRLEARAARLGGRRQKIEALRALAKAEKKVRRHLERIPWLDSLVQPEIYHSMAATRRQDRQDPEMEDLIAESRFLFEAARNGVARARQWFDGFEESFTEETHTPSVEEFARMSVPGRATRSARPIPSPPPSPGPA